MCLACAVNRDATDERLGTTRQSVIAGTSDKHDPAVVMIMQRPSSSPTDLAFICTGSVVAPHVVLTAAHCIDRKGVGQGELSVFLGNDLDDSTQFSRFPASIGPPSCADPSTWTSRDAPGAQGA